METAELTPEMSIADLLTPDEVAGILKVHVATVRRLYLKNKMRTWRVGGLVRIPKSEVILYLKGNHVEES